MLQSGNLWQQALTERVYLRFEISKCIAYQPVYNLELYPERSSIVHAVTSAAQPRAPRWYIAERHIEVYIRQGTMSLLLLEQPSGRSAARVLSALAPMQG